MIASPAHTEDVALELLVVRHGGVAEARAAICRVLKRIKWSKGVLVPASHGVLEQRVLAVSWGLELVEAVEADAVARPSFDLPVHVRHDDLEELMLKYRRQRRRRALAPTADEVLLGGLLDGNDGRVAGDVPEPQLAVRFVDPADRGAVDENARRRRKLHEGRGAAPYACFKGRGDGGSDEKDAAHWYCCELGSDGLKVAARAESKAEMRDE